MMIALYLGLFCTFVLLQQFHKVEGFLHASPPLLSFPVSSFGIGSRSHYHVANSNRQYKSTALHIYCPKNLLADSTKLDTTIESGSFILFIMSEIVSLTNIIAMLHYSSVQFTLDEMGRIKNLEQKLSRPDPNTNADDINEGRFYCMGDNGTPFEHMSIVPKIIESILPAMAEYTQVKKLPLQWEKKLISIEHCLHVSIGPCTIVKLLNDEDIVVLEVPLRTSYIVRNYSWLAQAHLQFLPYMEEDNPFQVFASYGRWDIVSQNNGQHDSLSFKGAPTKDMPDKINIPMTLVATWAGKALMWGWSRPDLLGVDAESETFSPRVLEHSHAFKGDMDGHDGDDPITTAVASNNPILACTLHKTFMCTSREAGTFCLNAIASANTKSSNDFVGLYIANVGNGLWFFTFKRSDYESLGIHNSTASDTNDPSPNQNDDSTPEQDSSTVIEDSNQLNIQQIVNVANTFNSGIRTRTIQTQTLILIALVHRLQKAELLLLSYSISCGL